MAKTAENKLSIARRIYDLVVNKYGMKPHDLIFDTLTFTLGSGDEEFSSRGDRTIESIRLIKKEFQKLYIAGCQQCFIRVVADNKAGAEQCFPALRH